MPLGSMPVDLRGQHVGCGRDAGDVSGPRGLHPGVGAVQPPQAELDDGPAAGGAHYPGRLGGHHGLEVDLVEQEALHQLRLMDGCNDFDDGLLREHHRALRRRVHVAAEAERGQVIDELARELRQRGDILQRFRGERHRLQVVQGVVQPGRDQVVALPREPAREQVEDGGLHQALAQVGLEHLELVEVGQEGGVGVRDPRAARRHALAHRQATSSMSAPAVRISSTARSPSPGSTSAARVASRMRCTSKAPNFTPSSTLARTQ